MDTAAQLHCTVLHAAGMQRMHFSGVHTLDAQSSIIFDSRGGACVARELLGASRLHRIQLCMNHIICA